MLFNALLEAWYDVIGPELDPVTQWLEELEDSGKGFFHTFQFIRTKEPTALTIFRHPSGYDILMHDAPNEVYVRIVKEGAVVVDSHPKLFDPEWVATVLDALGESPGFDFSDN